MTSHHKPLILGTGLNGLVGSKLVAVLKNTFRFENLDISHPVHPVDITDEIQLNAILHKTEAKFLIHCAAFTDVGAAWLQKDDKSGLAYRVNVIGTENIAKACRQKGIHMIHISTAYVFDGQKPAPYLETDQPHAIEWYGQTKLWAEEAVQQYAQGWTILRIDQPFRSDPFIKPDIVRRIINSLRNSTLPPQFNNHYFGPTFIDDFAMILQQVIDLRLAGLYHATSNETWTDYDFTMQIAQRLKVTEKVKIGDLNAYIKTSQRPYQKNTALNCDKLYTLLKYKPTSIKKALAQCQLETNIESTQV